MNQGAAQYARARTETASSSQVLLLLLRAARASMARAERDLRAGRVGPACCDIDKASQIVGELLATLDHARAPELCANLSATYEFVLAKLVGANAARRPEPLEEALRVFAPIADAFEAVIASGSTR